MVNNTRKARLTLQASLLVPALTTTVNDRRASVNSIILFVGLDFHYYDVDPHISSRANSSFVVGHKNHGHDTDIGYVIIGMIYRGDSRDWNKVKGYLSDALEYGDGMSDINDVRDSLAKNQADLWVGEKAR